MDYLYNQFSYGFSEGATAKGLRPWVSGITVTASNPYWFLWWATAGAGSLMLAANHGIVGAICFYLGHVLADYIWFTFVALTIAKGRRLFTPLIYRLVLGICGLFLIGLASYFIYSGAGFWFFSRFNFVLEINLNYFCIFLKQD